jgi:protein TonB
MKRHRLAVCAALLIVTLLSFLPMSPLADSAPVQSVTAQVKSTTSSETQGSETGEDPETPESLPPAPPAPPALAESVESELFVPPAPPAPPASPEKVEAGPQLLQESVVLPVYPEEARRAGVQGRVLLEALVRADGSVVGVVVKESVAGYPELDRKAVEAVAQWRFQPATINGNPVDSSVEIPIEFRLDSKKAK